MDLEQTFRELKARREGAHMPHVYYGDPNEEFSLKLIQILAENGADLIELGIPFSDPTADGPTFQAACDRALKKGITPAKCIEGIKKLRRCGLELPIIVTTYYNIPYVIGIKSFLCNIQRAGVQALIVPNLPVEEADILMKEGKKLGLHIILQVAPTTTAERLKRIIDIATGLLYIINIEGVTGARNDVTTSTLELVDRIRRYTNLPLLGGFGISKREHAKVLIQSGADGVIVGSAYAKLYEKNLMNPVETLEEIIKLAQQIKQGCIEGYKQRFNYNSNK